MTDAELQAIRERAEKATPGPWRHCYRRSYDGGGIYAGVPNHPCETVNDRFDDCDCSTLPVVLAVESEYLVGPDADGEFLAHARSDIPALLSEVYRLRAELVKYGNDILDSPGNRMGERCIC